MVNVGIDVEAARKEEERIMLRDARQWLNSGQIIDVRHAKSGGTALHVAAAKGYTEVLKYVCRINAFVLPVMFLMLSNCDEAVMLMHVYAVWCH